MTKHDKVLKRLLSRPTDFTWNELRTLMLSFGYALKTGGGSSRKFIRDEAAFMIHEPHPEKVLKPYQVRGVIAFLKQEGDIS